ncbi:MAG: tetratricopeptide repeat-containing sensor histidine kinase [Reichenbachiella sp.]|uniref:tetratricopeptide repeat-containing sensor histidine kinase n=1 Tax=Reichenbachiella sp. TaxID=2184521 RepID=UPI00329884CB
MAGSFLLLFFKAPCQNQRVADSLTLVLKGIEVRDSSYFDLLEEVAYQQRNAAKKLYYSNLLINQSHELNEPLWESRGYILNGHAHRLLGDFDVALQRYLKGLQIAENMGFQNIIAGAYSSVGDLYSLSQRHDESIVQYRMAFEMFKELDDSVNMGSTLLNTGDEFLNIKNYDSALVFFQRSKLIFNRIDYPMGTAFNLGNIGLVLAELGQYVRAEENINQAITILEELGDRYPIAVYQTSLAEIYAERGEYHRAVKYAKSSLNIGFEEGLKEQIRDASLKLSELYKSVGKSDEAYTYLKQYITYRDSINNEETIRKMADLRTEYEVNKKQIEVDLLSEQAKLNRIVAWSAVFIIALLLVLTIALLKIYRIKDRAVRIVRQRRRVIAAQRNKLDEVNKTKDRFFSIVSHDIRGPISNFQGISGLINVLADSKDVDGLKQLGSMMEASAKEVSELLDNLLEWALSQEGRIPYDPQTISLREISQSNLNIMLNMAIAKNIDLVGQLPEDVTIKADKNSVSTIIRNLLSNAIKFTPEAGNVTLNIAEEDGFGVIEIKDTGIGISQEKLENLFSLKGTRSQWGTKGEKGIGLGLLLVHEFVELNKGRIEVQSKEGEGTSFKVFLPSNIT